MVRLCVTSLLSIISISFGLLAQPPKGKDEKKKEPPPKEKQKDKDTQKPKDSKPAVGKDFTGMFKTKDVEKKTITLIIDGKEKVFKVTDTTKFIGPRGGESDDKIKDDRLDKGYKITIVADAKDEGLAAEVKLPYRNDRVEDKKKDDKKK
jgi:hypothetical protein